MIDLTVGLDQLPDPLPIEPLAGPFDVTITPPGSKSLTCRAYVLAALAKGDSRIVRPLRADDTDTLLAALATLGAASHWDGEDVIITGVNGRFPRGGEINLGDGGAPTRFMIAAACLADQPVVVDGSPRMRERPIAQGVEMLRQLGARIEYVENDERLPVRVEPGDPLGGGELEIGPMLSSQFISAVMLIASHLSSPLKLWFATPMTSASYVRLTGRVLEQWGVNLHESTHADDRKSVYIYTGPVGGRTYSVESDASSATYWLAAAAIVPDAVTQIDGLPPSSSQADIEFSALLEGLGALRERLHGHLIGMRYGRPLKGTDCDMSAMPDAAITLGATLATASSPSSMTGLGSLRVKESDRIEALANELRKLGCAVVTADDTVWIDPTARHEKPAEIETYHDHRIAMAFAVLGLVRPGISVKNPACVSKSYPTFWSDFARLYD